MAGLNHNARHSDPQSGYSSSSVSTAHRRVFSTANSNMTNTDESAHSVESNTDSLDQVILQVYREEDTSSPMLLCDRRNVTPKFLRSYSDELVEGAQRESIDGENYLIFQVSNAVNANAFRLMVDNIGNVPTVAPSGNGQTADISFSDFFELSIILWSYVCKIDHWGPVADYIRDSHWVDDFKQWPARRLTQWLFIALVFYWPDIFETTSSALIVDFSELDAELRRAPYLPREVINRITNARRDYMRKTYDEIRSIGLSLTCNHRTRLLSLPQDIHVDLFQAPKPLDLRQQLPEDIYKRMSPGEVLRGVGKTIEKAHSVPQAQTPLELPTASTTQASTRSSVHSDKSNRAQRTLTENSKALRRADAGDNVLDVLQEVWRFGKDARKRRSERKSSSTNPNGQQRPQEPVEPAPLTTQEIDNICEALLGQIKVFRTTHLRSLNIDDFSLLRDDHVLSAPRP